MQLSTSMTCGEGSIADRLREDESSLRLKISGTTVQGPDATSPEASPEPVEAEGAGADEEGAGLDDAVRSEREYVRERLRDELKREPTEEEMDAWLREQTEGY
jgi:hypothetical protein